MIRLWCSFVVICICCLSSVKVEVLPKDSNYIFSLPTKVMDEEDLLEEHGRFMLSMMNTAVDPCENFYEYACGNWQNDSMVPSLGQKQSFTDAMEVNVNKLILEYLKNKTASDENTAEGKMKDFFESCLNMSQDLSQGYRTIFNSIKEPILKDGETPDWILLNFCLENTPSPLFPISALYNFSNYMYEIYLKDLDELSTLNTYNFTKLSEDFKFENKEAMKDEWEELLNFEKKLLATVKETNESKCETWEDFIKVHNSSDLNFERLFDLAFNETAHSSWKINYKLKNFTELNKFLNQSETTILFKYIRWRTILVFYDRIVLKDEQTTTEKCQSLTMHYFKSTLIPWYVRTTFDKERRADALGISKHLKETFYTLIDRTSWLDNKTKSGAKSKLRAMDIIFGYTDDMLGDPLEINEQFKDINIGKNFWVNLMNLEGKHRRDIENKIGKVVIENDFDTKEVNAYYRTRFNKAFMTVSFSQLPLYHIKLPHSLKFGGIGSVIAHEMAHAFDSDCYRYDYDGRKRNWWSPESLRNFEERYQCLESQYNKFVFKGKRTSGNKTSGDNIADNVGLHIAYQSYLRFLDENANLESAKDRPLPGVEFNNKHLFFLKFAQMWCDGSSADERLEIIQYDEHSLNEFRALGTLMNMPEFSEEFNCALGTNMNPLKKCIIYGKE